jgi:hypothetical protein
MLYIAFVVFWVVILTPIAITHLRDRGPEKSIQHFHEEHARFAERELSAEPVNRLDAGYARPIGRGTVFADDNYDRGYAPVPEYQPFVETGPGQHYEVRRTSRQRRLAITLTLAGTSLLSWLGAAFVGGIMNYFGVLTLIADASYVGLYFVAVHFGFLGYQRETYDEEPNQVVDFIEHRDSRYSQEPIDYYDQVDNFGEYRRDALG